jgi:hypothetical protein
MFPHALYVHNAVPVSVLKALNVPSSDDVCTTEPSALSADDALALEGNARAHRLIPAAVYEYNLLSYDAKYTLNALSTVGVENTSPPVQNFHPIADVVDPTALELPLFDVSPRNDGHTLFVPSDANDDAIDEDVGNLTAETDTLDGRRKFPGYGWSRTVS